MLSPAWESDNATVTYSVSKHITQSAQDYGLVDGGANGIIAGEECIWIGGPSHPRKVNVTGIDQHQLNNIPVGTVGSLSISNRGPVILIINEAAYTGKHTSILSRIQIQAYNNCVDDRPLSLGGRQRIITPEGYVFPLSVICGLPYLKMRKYTQHEYDTLPHVVMDRTNTPPNLWFLCMEYVAYLLIPTSDPTLGNKQPILRATGTVGDISPILAFQWLEPVYFKTHDTSFPSESPEIMGYFVGFSENVGHMMTYKIWNKSTNKILDRSAVRSAKTQNINLKAMTPDRKQEHLPADNLLQHPKPSATKYIFSKVVGPSPNSFNGEPEYLDQSSTDH